MTRKLAITKLKAFLIIDILIVAIAGGIYLYLQNQGLVATAARPSEFTVSNLTITPLEVEEGEPVAISINLTNIGDLEGTYMANLTINGAVVENQSIILGGGYNSTLVEFSYLPDTIGDYTVEISGLNGSFRVKEAPPSSSNIRLSDIRTNPYEGWVDEPITISVLASNPSSETDKLSVKLWVDDALVETKKIELEAGASTTVEFTVNATTEGKHSVKVNSLTASFLIVRTGYHTLTINRSGGGSTPLPFTLDGVTHNTAYIELLPVGEYEITVPSPFTTSTAVFEFAYWNTGERSTTIRVNLQSRTIVVVTYTLISGYASCPSLFYWNGTNYVYVTEVANAGWLGYMDYIDENGEIVFSGGNPWDFVKLDNTQLTPRIINGESYYDMRLFQQWDEIFYLDTAYLMVIDHSAGTDVYSTMNNYINQAFNGQIYSVNKTNLSTPVSAINEKGESVLSQIQQLDGVFTFGNNGFASPSWDNITSNQLTLDLGDLSDAEAIKLVINGMVDWGDPKYYYEWIDKLKAAFAEGLITNGTQVYPAPYMEVMDANGDWIRVPLNRQMPTPSDYVSRSFVVDLTGIFPADVTDYKIRINYFFNVTFDYIAIDTSPQENITVQRLNASATLSQEEFGSTKSTSSGNFTKYGNVTQLLLDADDMYIIGRQGDLVSVLFPTADLAPLEEGMERDYILFVASWFKDPPENWGYGFDFTTDPLPFINMSGFPYPSTESYPYDAAHLQYLQEYNTRVIYPP